MRLEIKTLRGEHYESIIKHGVVLREKDLKTGSFSDLDDVISIYRKDFSSLPDTPLLALIGGNYGILTEFLGTAERIVINPGGVRKRLLNSLRRLLPGLRNLLRRPWSDLREYNRSAKPADVYKRQSSLRPGSARDCSARSGPA